MRRVYDFGGPDRRQVSVTLVGKYRPVREHTFNPRRDRRRATMSSLVHVTVEVVICENRAADRCDPDGPVEELHLLKNLSDKAVNNSMGTTRAVVRFLVGQPAGLFKYNSHHCTSLRYARAASTTPCWSGTIPPLRP
jgi:hypothetical protein